MNPTNKTGGLTIALCLLASLGCATRTPHRRETSHPKAGAATSVDRATSTATPGMQGWGDPAPDAVDAATRAPEAGVRDTSTSGTPRKVLAGLDADANGLYDDAERKALLDVFQKECPELTGTFDADGDGKVTVAEQTAGRHPLSFLTQPMLKSDVKIPWAIDIYPEWIMSGFVQEDVAEGPVAEHAARGTRAATATQSDEALRPVKSGPRTGVEFAAGSGRHLTMPGHRDARWDYRWCVFTFRIDGDSGTDEETVLLDLNRAEEGNGSNKSSPKIWYRKDTGLSIQYTGRNKWGLDRRVMTTRDLATDGETWNVVVCGIRYGRMFASVNGVALATKERQPDRFSGDWPYKITTYVGDRRKGNMAWAYDALVFGLTEPSEAMVRKVTGWAAHRLGFQGNLPADHPYKTARPVLDEEDFPYRYFHDDEKWNAWGQSVKDKSFTRVNAGGPRLEPRGFERVFYDDFRAPRVTASTSGEGDLWMGPGFNTAVGGDAPLVTPGRKPNTYPYDAENKRQILSLVKQGKRWRGSAFYSVNDLGHGYTWKGPKIFRIRCMFPDIPQKRLARGLFPAFWSYDPDYLFWRTANRIEVDWFEFDGQNGKWYNGMSSHYHYAHVKNIFAKNPKSYKRYKVYSGELTEKKGKIPGGLYFWDGVFHTWEWIVDRDMTYTNVTIRNKDGRDRWVEICRCKTSPTYLERLDLQLDYALKARHGTPESDRQDFVVDWVEVLQRTDQLATIPKPFTARPKLSGAVAAGGTITCTPNLRGVTDVRYYWFADGYPLTWGARDTWTVTPAEAGKKIRCMVKAVGARSMPEAWSDVLE